MLLFLSTNQYAYHESQVGAVVQKVCAHITGLPKAAEVAESPLDKMFGDISDKGKSLVALKEEAAERRMILQRATQEAGELNDLLALTATNTPHTLGSRPFGVIVTNDRVLESVHSRHRNVAAVCIKHRRGHGRSVAVIGKMQSFASSPIK